jgi:hypothetical protein
MTENNPQLTPEQNPEPKLEPSVLDDSSIDKADALTFLNDDSVSPEDLAISTFETLSEKTKAHYVKLAKAVRKLPDVIRHDIDELIDKGVITNGEKLKNIAVERNKDPLIKIPIKEAFRAYAVIRQRERSVIEKTRRKLERAVELAEVTEDKSKPATSRGIYEDLTLSVENKRERLENLVKAYEQRFTIVKEMQKHDPSATYEATLLAIGKEIRQTTETLVKMREDLKVEGEKEVERYINTKLNAILQVARQAYISIHGKEKEELFNTALKLKLKENSLGNISL